ncbi:polyketide cyclase [Terrabacter sp. Root85]|uniref:SRPBCC family protein n=1 Tax=unclassified Terrabacter TaxID=2630222 RepID=UPI0006F9F8D0|nr:MULTISPECIES: SRPBCC family protein [unclassified Terrabacter]KRC89360.1 polyketide cyclase [Terrabacter sp. Root85]KRF48386.1 polyketide cyclase [Terrabacter sp. Soil811]
MPSVTRSFTVHPAPAVVIAYLKDFANAEEWDPGTESCTRVGDGPVAVGARWHNVSKIAGVTTELDYELAELTDTRIVLVGRNDSATSTDTITVLPSGEGSEITYHAELDMHGLANLAAPAMKLVFEKLANDTEEQLTRVLESR